MSDDKQTFDQAKLDDAIATRFARMREHEAASAPAFDPQRPRALPDRSPERPWLLSSSLPRVAAALALVGIAVVMLTDGPGPEPDPAALYTSIMDKQTLQTDSLLIVSASVLPSMAPLPELYDMDAEFTQDSLSNGNPSSEELL